ncbi:MAG: DUF2254 domain-containing protein [Ignavibacteriaceae bacterium]
MKKFTKVLYKSYIYIINSIAFFPVLISAALFILSICILYFEGTHFSSEIKKNFPFLFVSSYQNARQILSTLITGIISLTVFSFSMVMIVLNQASSNFSPRVIPGVITKKAHQIILGFCIGTIIYSLIIVHNVQNTTQAFRFPQIGILVAEILGIICLILFVYFIHSISQSIQVDNILVKVLNDTLSALKAEKGNDDKANGEKDHIEEPSTKNWIIIDSIESGYYRNFETTKLLLTACKEDLIIEISNPRGAFILKGIPFLKINKKIKDELKEMILNTFIFYQEEYINENFIYGFKQTTEVAVKALSPGINDPGTAIRAIDHLTLMYSEMLTRSMDEYYSDSENHLRIIQRNYSLDDLLYNYLTPIREYGNSDVNIVLKLLKCFETLIELEKGKERYLSLFHRHIDIILEDADKNIVNKIDRGKINNILEQLNTHFKKENHFQKKLKIKSEIYKNDLFRFDS